MSQLLQHNVVNHITIEITLVYQYKSSKIDNHQTPESIEYGHYSVVNHAK